MENHIKLLLIVFFIIIGACEEYELYWDLPNLPVVETHNPNYISYSSARCGGKILYEGNSLVNCGICYSKLSNPTINDSTIICDCAEGVFTSYITKLNAKTTYFVRAFATNNDGTGYGNEVNFTTK